MKKLFHKKHLSVATFIDAKQSEIKLSIPPVAIAGGNGVLTYEKSSHNKYLIVPTFIDAKQSETKLSILPVANGGGNGVVTYKKNIPQQIPEGIQRI